MLLSDVQSITFAILFLVVIYMVRSFRIVKQMSEGKPEMSKLAEGIRRGTAVFERTIFKRIVPVSIIIAALLCCFIEKYAGLAFLGGLICTTIATIVGMSVATYTNVRATATALEYKDAPRSVAGANTVNTTIKGSKICGIVVHSSVLFGLAVTMALTKLDPNAVSSSIIPLRATVHPLVARLTAYSLGWSVVAMFCRVAGGIFTKAADIGADLVGKVFMHFDEDDPRNPAVMADLCGDDTNDIAGNQADLGESFAATPVTAIVAALSLFSGNPALLEAAIAFAFALPLGGLVCSIIALHYASNMKESEDPGHQLNISMIIAVVGTLLTSLLLSWRLFHHVETLPAEFGSWASPFFASAIGIVSGAGVGLAAKYFTDLKCKWAVRVADMAKKGTGLCVSMSLIAGLISVFFEILIVATASFAAYLIAGLYGLTIMALGMFSFVAQPIAADAFGPISDNAGGIAESCGLPPEVREITDLNDAAGNSSAAVGKGFAISGAAGVVVAQINTYLESFGGKSLDFSKPNVIFGFLLGVGLMALFCGLLGYFTLDAAGKMADECRRQLQDEDVVAGRKLPDSEKCIDISTVNGIRRMGQAVSIPIIATIVIGFLFGAETFGGTLIGVIGSGLLLAIFTSNAGGLADNAKKRYEAGLEIGFERGMASYDAPHDAATHGDTIGDWMKDVVAVCVDIFMKIMGTLAIMLGALFVAYQVFPL